MEVHFTVEQEVQLSQLTHDSGKDAEHLLKDAALRLLKEAQRFREDVERGIAAADRGEFVDSAQACTNVEPYCAPDACALDGPAAQDLYNITRYIQRDNPTAARQVAKILYDGCEGLAHAPHRGRKAPLKTPANSCFQNCATSPSTAVRKAGLEYTPAQRQWSAIALRLKGGIESELSAPFCGVF